MTAHAVIKTVMGGSFVTHATVWDVGWTAGTVAGVTAETIGIRFVLCPCFGYFCWLLFVTFCTVIDAQIWLG